jgi:hypothetical protein
MVYKQVKVNITKPQLYKALNGKPVRFSANQIGVGEHYLSLHPANVKLVEKAALKGKGVVINISEGELLSTCEDMQGKGFFGDIWKGLKSAYNWTKKHIIDTPIYQSTVKPLVRGLVDTGATALSAYVPQAAPAIMMAKNELGKQTGAFGLKKGTKAQKKAILQAKGLYLS